jgi:succinyl-diaminopimelate desuccinylase
MEQALRAIIAQHQEGWIDFTKALIEIPTENPPGVAYRACTDLLAHKLDEFGLEYTLLEAPAPSSSHLSREPGHCLLSGYGAGEKTLYFHGHYDVVPASDPGQFRPFIQENKLSDRGSSDMKGGLAAMMAAIQAVKECGIPLRGKIGLTIIPDEETGGQRGSQYLFDHGLLGDNGIGMLTAEPTDGHVWTTRIYSCQEHRGARPDLCHDSDATSGRGLMAQGEFCHGQIAMSILSLIPIFGFFLAFQRLLTEGISTSGLKG